MSNTPPDQSTSDTEASASENDRRRFLMSCGRFAATVPPAMTVLLSTSLTSEAIAKSTGNSGGGGGGGRGGGWGGGHGGGRGHKGPKPKHGK